MYCLFRNRYTSGLLASLLPSCLLASQLNLSIEQQNARGWAGKRVSLRQAHAVHNLRSSSLPATLAFVLSRCCTVTQIALPCPALRHIISSCHLADPQLQLSMLLLLSPTLSGRCVRRAKAVLAASENAARRQLLNMCCNAGQGRAIHVTVQHLEWINTRVAGRIKT